MDFEALQPIIWTRAAPWRGSALFMLTLCFALFFCPGMCGAKMPDVLTIDRQATRPGDTITVNIEIPEYIPIKKDLKIDFPAAAGLTRTEGNWAGKRTYSQKFQITVLGKIRIGPGKILITDLESNQNYTVPFSAFEIVSRSGISTEELGRGILPLKPLASIPEPGTSHLFYLLPLFAVLILGVYLASRKKTTHKTGSPASGVGESWSEMEQWLSLLDKGGLSAAEEKTIHFTLSRLLKEFISQKTGLKVKALTTDEMQKIVSSLGVDDTVILRVLQYSDMAKFSENPTGELDFIKDFRTAVKHFQMYKGERSAENVQV